MTQSVSAGHFSQSGDHVIHVKIYALDTQRLTCHPVMALCAFGMFLGGLGAPREVSRDRRLLVGKTGLRIANKALQAA